MILALVLVVLGVFARFIPHAWNFTPVLAIALFAGVYLKRSQAVLLPLALMMVSDIFLGLHPMLFFTWGSVVLIALIGVQIRKNNSSRNVFIGALASAVLFFIVTNFGAWLAYYPLTWKGFVACYVLAVPFFRSTLASTFLYTVVLFGGYEFLAGRIKNTRLAPVLINHE